MTSPSHPFPRRPESTPESFLAHKYTHLVIGGGTAGLVVAARLSENPNLTVGILEAGSAAFEDRRINVPGRFGETLGSEHDWPFETTKQDGLDGRSLPIPRGKVLGGTSALNFMTWNRGCKEDYDAWKTLGNDGWSFDELLPFFKKSENFHPPTPDHQAKNHSIYDLKYHGVGGPLDTVYSASYGASHRHWHKTLHKLGIKTNQSHFSGSNMGVWTALTSVTPGKRERCYSAPAYYRPNADRSNLILLTEALVQNIVIEQDNDEWVAKGARFSHTQKEHVVHVSGEVILCGGSISSPQLLELSGVGNPSVLEAAGIDCKVPNVNVGENLQDHMMTAMIYEIDPSVTTLEDLRADPVRAAAADEEYASKVSGPLTTLPSSISYLPFTHFIPPSELTAMTSELLDNETKVCSPYLQHDKIISSRLTCPPNIGQIEYNFDVSNYSPYYKSESGKKYATMLMMLQYPFSRGASHTPPTMLPVAAGKASSEDKPIIDPRYYGGQGGKVDFECMVRSQRFAAKICRTTPLNDLIVRRVFPPESMGENHRMSDGFINGSTHATPSTTTGVEHTSPSRDDGTVETEQVEEDFDHWVRSTTMTDWHPVGTCSMGPSTSAGGVVDSRLRVHGVKKLRVCDASVMPLQISAHLQATVYAIGEKGAEMFKEDFAGDEHCRENMI